MTDIPFAIGAGIPAGTLWFVVVYFACKRHFKRNLSWLYNATMWAVVVVCTGLVTIMKPAGGSTDESWGVITTIGVPFAVSFLLVYAAFLLTRPAVQEKSKHSF